MDLSDLTEDMTSFFVLEMIDGMLMPYVATYDSKPIVLLFMSAKDAMSFIEKIDDQNSHYVVREISTILALGLVHAGKTAHADADVMTPNLAYHFLGPNWLPG